MAEIYYKYRTLGRGTATTAGNLKHREGDFYRCVASDGSVEFSSVQDDINALGKTHMRFTPSLRSFPNVAFETVPMFV